MRAFFGAVLFLMMLASPVFAAWTDDFAEDVDELGLDEAVENALENEVAPNEILTFIVSNSDKFAIRTGLKALYCAGVDRETVQAAAEKLGITVEELSIALEESLAECGSKLSLDDRDILELPDSGATQPEEPDEPEDSDGKKPKKDDKKPKKGRGHASPSTPNQLQ